MEIKDLQDYVAIVNDWPKKGIVFKDITPLMNDEKHIVLLQIKLWNTQKN